MNDSIQLVCLIDQVKLLIRVHTSYYNTASHYLAVTLPLTQLVYLEL